MRASRWIAWSLGPLLACGEPTADPVPTGSTTSTTTPADSGSTAEPSDDTSTSGPAESGSGSTTGPALPCNGHVQLCDRTFDQVVFPGTHNSHAATSEGFPAINANHVDGIAQQLANGVRVMLIDIYPDPDDADVVLMCHGPCNLASTPHLEGLGAIVDFLQSNPREVLTIIYQDAVPPEMLAQDFATTGADALTFVHPPGEPWPTLGEMIEADTRLVVTAESAGPPPAWLHHVWDEAWDTPYGPSSIDGLSCELNRGSPEHDLFLLNHWVNTPLGLPSPENAAEANALDVLVARAEECAAQWRHPTNFVVVDFYEQGDLFAAVDALNGL